MAAQLLSFLYIYLQGKNLKWGTFFQEYCWRKSVQFDWQFEVLSQRCRNYLRDLKRLQLFSTIKLSSLGNTGQFSNLQSAVSVSFTLACLSPCQKNKWSNCFFFWRKYWSNNPARWLAKGIAKMRKQFTWTV